MTVWSLVREDSFLFYVEEHQEKTSFIFSRQDHAISLLERIPHLVVLQEFEIEDFTKKFLAEKLNNFFHYETQTFKRVSEFC